MKRTLFVVAVLTLTAITTIVSADGDNLLRNGDFENGLNGWGKMWSQGGDGCKSIELVNSTESADNVHSGSYAVHLTHTCEREWTFTTKDMINVTYEQKYEISYWARVKGRANFKIGTVLYNESGSSLGWSGSDSPKKNDTKGEWVHVTGVIWITKKETSYFLLRCTGSGPGEVYVDDIKVRDLGNLPHFVDFSTGDKNSVEMRMDVQTGFINVTLPGTGLQWEQLNLSGPKLKKLYSYDETSFSMEISGGYNMTVSLTKGVPEIVYKISSNATSALSRFPMPFKTKGEGHVVFPLNEGISFPITAADEIGTRSYSLAAGHGLPMAFWGIVDKTSTGPGYMAIVDTPNDANLVLNKNEGSFLPYSQWLLQKGEWAYDRIIRFRFFESGGHVRMAKIFREYRKAQGNLVTLKDKLAKNPSVDLLIGSPNIWSKMNARTFVPKLQNAGIKRMLWSYAASAEDIDFMNNNLSDVLTSRYDIYQDTMDPANFQYLSGVHSDWPTEAFPDELVYNSSGDWVRGWEVIGKDGKTPYYCGNLCDSVALKYAKKKATEELKTKHYKCRFIDTTTAPAWRECYHKDHPMTRTESREWRMKLLDYFYTDYNLVVGSETGHEAAVPYLHYFEGMMSLVPYRASDPTRNTYNVLYDVPPQITKFQLGHVYRLPLWELVYHDCVVSYWFWTDYNNKLPAVWDKRDLFNALYGVPPMYLINQTWWDAYKDRFVQSYNNTVPIAREVGYSVMESHEFLTEDRDVQQTTFRLSDTLVKKVIVNFNTETSYTHPGTGATIKAMSYYTYYANETKQESSGSSESEPKESGESTFKELSESDSKQKNAGARTQTASFYLIMLLSLIIIF